MIAVYSLAHIAEFVAAGFVPTVNKRNASATSVLDHQDWRVHQMIKCILMEASSNFATDWSVRGTRIEFATCQPLTPQTTCQPNGGGNCVSVKESSRHGVILKYCSLKKPDIARSSNLKKCLNETIFFFFSSRLLEQIRCKCQDLGPGPGWDERVRGGCHEERQRDAVSLIELVGRSRDLQRLQTDFELDVERLATSGPYPCLRRLTLTRLAVSGMPRSALTGRELQMLLLQMPALRELRCNVAYALAEVGVGAQSMLSRLEVLNVLLDQPAQAAGISPVELLARFCPNIREVS